MAILSGGFVVGCWWPWVLVAGLLWLFVGCLLICGLFLGEACFCYSAVYGVWLLVCVFVVVVIYAC